MTKRTPTEETIFRSMNDTGMTFQEVLDRSPEYWGEYTKIGGKWRNVERERAGHTPTETPIPGDVITCMDEAGNVLKCIRFNWQTSRKHVEMVAAELSKEYYGVLISVASRYWEHGEQHA